MQPTKKEKGPSMGLQKQNHFSQFKWTSTNVISIKSKYSTAKHPNGKYPHQPSSSHYDLQMECKLIMKTKILQT